MEQPQKTWANALSDGWAAIPGADLLSQESHIWDSFRIHSPSIVESSSLAIVSRLLKYGKSVGLILPSSSPDTFLRMLTYLHRLRLDTINGLIRAPWLQPFNVCSRGDVVLFTRPGIRLRQMYKASDLHVKTLRPPKTLSDAPLGSIRSILVDGNSSDRFSIFEALEKTTTPFVFVVDGTTTGIGEEAITLDHDLFEYFPSIPRVVVISLGDTRTVKGLSKNGTNTHLWHLRIGDAQILNFHSVGNPPTAINVVEVSDNTANSLLKNLLSHLHSLSLTLLVEHDSIQKQILQPLKKVFHSLSVLSMPCSVLEEALTKNIRGGMYPKLPLNIWLERVRTIKCRYGTSYNAVNSAIEVFLEAMLVFNSGISGKTQLLLQRVKENCESNKSQLILLGTKVESDAFTFWIENQLSTDVINKLIIHPMDGVNSNSVEIPPVDVVIIVGTIWPNRQHWLAHPCKILESHSYAYESNGIEQMLKNWWSMHGDQSFPTGDKLLLWSLRFPNRGRFIDADTIPSMNKKFYKSISPMKGRYSHSFSAFEIDYDDRHENWLEALVAEPNNSNHDATQIDSRQKSTVLVRVEEYSEPIPWPRDKTLLILRNDSLDSILPESLQKGDEIVFLPQTVEKIAVQEAIFRLFVGESIGLEQHLLYSQKWNNIIDSMVDAYGHAKNLQSILESNGIQITDQAIRHWIRHERIGPENEKVIELFAKMLEHTSPASYSRKIFNAINYIRQEHRNIGRDLRKGLIARAEGASSIKVGRMTLQAEALDTMIELCHVYSIEVLEKIEPLPALTAF